MTPTPPSPEDDLLDLAGLGVDSKSKSKTSQQESDFEKELEALFAEDLAEAAESGSTLTAAKTQAAKDEEADDDPLQLTDLLDDTDQAAPAASAASAPPADDEDDILDLGGFAAQPAAEPLADSATLDAEDEDDILDLSAFASDGPMDLTPPSDAAGGKDGDIDTDALDTLISDLGDSKKPATAMHPPVQHDAPLDDIDMHGLLDDIDVPPAPKAALATEPEDEMLDLSLDDLVEDMPPAPSAETPKPVATPDMDMDLLAELTGSAPATPSLDDLTLPDLSEHLAEPATAEPELSLPDMSEPESPAMAHLADEEPALDLTDTAEAEDMTSTLAGGLSESLADNLAMHIAAGVEADLASDADHHDLSGDMNLSLPDAHETEGLAAGLDADSILEADDIGGDTLDGFDGPMPEVGGELAMDANALLDQIDDTPVAETEDELIELTEPLPTEPATPVAPEAMATGLIAGGALVVGAAAVAEMAAESGSHMTPELHQLLAEHQKSLAEFQQKLAELKTQVTGGSINVVSIQGQLAEKDQVITELNERLRTSEEEALTLRQELADLRNALEEGLRTKTEEDEKNAAQLKERLALLEDRQDQAARDMQAEIERAVPREAAKVIREEIAALADSMRD